MCKLNTRGGEGGGGDCSMLSCAWKAPRDLTGSLASTTRSSSSLFLSSSRQRYRDETWGSYLTAAPASNILGRSSGYDCKILVLKDGNAHALHLSGPSGSYDVISAETLWEDLKPTISYFLVGELMLVWKALKLAFEAHSGQKRRSGEPFIIHPVEVARILGELELDWESIAAGLLHDTVEDTNVVTFERIEKDFGSTVRRIVEGETKVSKLGKLKYKNKTSCDVKADDLRQMFLAMTEEASIALETLQVFAPLAKLLGMYQIKSELENLSFMYTNSQDYEKISKRVAELYEDHERELTEAKN